jgi:hypothetical protein
LINERITTDFDGSQFLASRRKGLRTNDFGSFFDWLGLKIGLRIKT